MVCGRCGRKRCGVGRRAPIRGGSGDGEDLVRTENRSKTARQADGADQRSGRSGSAKRNARLIALLDCLSPWLLRVSWGWEAIRLVQRGRFGFPDVKPHCSCRRFTQRREIRGAEAAWEEDDPTLLCNGNCEPVFPPQRPQQGRGVPRFFCCCQSSSSAATSGFFFVLLPRLWLLLLSGSERGISAGEMGYSAG
jgi:hypothetical protein